MKMTKLPRLSVRAKALQTASRASKFLAEFEARERLENCDLLLDSTGPSLTKHYLFLSQMGPQRLAKFQKVHTFSGGTFAYLGYTAALQGELAKPLHEYFKVFDKEFRRTHHNGVLLSPLLRLKDLLLKRRLDFPKTAIAGTLELIFSKQFLETKIEDLPCQFQPYVTDSSTERLVLAREQKGIQTVRDLLESSILIPFFYEKSADDKYFDAAFAQDYKSRIRNFRDSERTVLASTPWAAGAKGNVHNFRCLESKDPRFEMLLDFAVLSLNIPSRKMNLELEVAFRPLIEVPNS